MVPTTDAIPVLSVSFWILLHIISTSSKSTTEESGISFGGYPVSAHSGKMISSTPFFFAVYIAFSISLKLSAILPDTANWYAAILI